MTRLQQKMGTHVVTLNAEMSMMAQENEALAQTIKSADLIIPDGAGVILYMRLRGSSTSALPRNRIGCLINRAFGKIRAKRFFIAFLAVAQVQLNKQQKTGRQNFPICQF